MRHPIIVHLPAGEHRICHCGESVDPPLCDQEGGAECRRAATLTLHEARTTPICQCGASSKAPICDGSHGYEKRRD